MEGRREVERQGVREGTSDREGGRGSVGGREGGREEERAREEGRVAPLHAQSFDRRSTVAVTT